MPDDAERLAALEREYREFRKLVADMRRYQIEFFDPGRRTGNSCRYAKDFERRVDKALAAAADAGRPRMF